MRKYLALLAAGLTMAQYSFATSIGYEPWNKTVAAAQFTGVIECTVAGYASSRFKVIETWRGEIKESEFYVQTGALVGQRLLLSLFSNSPNQEFDWPILDPFPLRPKLVLFSEPPARYAAPFSCYIQYPPPDQRELEAAFPKFKGNIAELKAAVQAIPPAPDCLPENHFSTEPPLSASEAREHRRALSKHRIVPEMQLRKQYQE